MKRLLLFQSHANYAQMLQQTFGSSLIAYWPMDETSGAIVYDRSGNARNAAYFSSITVNNTTSPNNKPAPLFSAGDVNAYSASLNAAFSGQSFSLGGFAKMSSAGVWTDATNRYLTIFNVDASNSCYVRRQATNNQLAFIYQAGGTSKSGSWYMGKTGFFHWLISVNKAGDSAKLYIDGAPVVSLTGLGTWAGNLNSAFTRIGSFSGAANFHSGWMSDVYVASRSVTLAEARILATARIRPRQIALLGDSLTAQQNNLQKWNDKLANNGLGGGWVGLMNHAASGATILSSLAGQVTAAANDNADDIIICLGTNDDNAGNMATLQTIIETAVDNLRVSNPNANIYYMNVPPKWTDATGTTEIDKSNIRTTVAAACTAKNVTCWDTYTVPWIAASDTSDGTHPTAAGHNNISNQAIARL